MNKTKSGFTIVELLIVIVVIGILAAMTIVAFNGIQQRAHNTKVVSGVKAYRDALTQYAVINGQYPSGAGCLGTGYPVDNVCWRDNLGNTVSLVAASFNTALSPYLPTRPEVAAERLYLYNTDHHRTGIYFNSGSGRMEYYLKGPNQECPIGSRANPGYQTTQCLLIFPNPATL